ncbi:multidrug MFS transporter [Thioclava sp. SK-1]|uniref:multidrug effflux MFS transporter n=1 Tax=Thioclava sp. SK-1 TaxID=1889770 RepID=UPI00082710E6|nr:multidrug effflux MFS transporter [Thioclava sp. SK-1]OCX63136.1 multidrug MFS transporter [Thioclava sp. SK-1]
MSQTDHIDPVHTESLSLREFTIMLASLIATVAFSIDAMLPALPEIARTMSPGDVNKAQLVLTSFVFGMGAGTLFVGPISDAIGRKMTILYGVGIYMIGSFIAAHAQSLEMLLISRFIQGLGAASPRIIPMAMVRDKYAGREMAKVTSIIMMIFIIVPAMAPSIGAVIIDIAGWRGVFYAFILFGTIGVTWMFLRQPETLTADKRRPLQFARLWNGVKEVLSDRQVLLYIVIITLGFGQMFAALSSAQQLYETYGVTDNFPKWFAGGALLAGAASFLNSRIVVRYGMRRIVIASYLMQVIASILVLGLMFAGMPQSGWGFAVFFLWFVSIFSMAGLTFGNLNALAMQKMGHMAGLAASIITAISTVGSVMLAAPVGLAFNGTALPLAFTTLTCSAVAYVLMRGTLKEE